MLNENSTVPYILQANDTFYKISKYYNITLDDLIEANPDINPDDVETGQMINLPIVPPHYSRSSISGTYTIKAGDTMYKLSRKYKVKLSALIKSNPHINPDAPLEGQTI
jgi:LysM repeat protein